MEVQQSSGCRPFEREPEILLVVDQIAKRYGRLPSEVLDMDVWEMSFAVACMMETDQVAGGLIKRINKDGMPVFPVVVLRD